MERCGVLGMVCCGGDGVVVVGMTRWCGGDDEEVWCGGDGVVVVGLRGGLPISVF